MGTHDHDHDGNAAEDHHRGLAGDLATLIERRRALQLIGGAGLLALAGCAAPTTTSSGPASTTASTAGPSTTSSAAKATTTGATASDCATIPEETAGPFPGDGSNGPDVLKQSGVVRSDIRSSFGSSTTVARGVPLTVRLKILERAKGCAALAGAAVYVWHCDVDGNYSLYSQDVTNENYLRGVQEAGGDGVVTFKTIFPGAYPGRWPHIHFEVYRSLADATGAGTLLATSQLALPEATCNVVYATDGYGQSAKNMTRTTLKTDMVFSDGATLETPATTGSVTDGFVATLDVTV